MIVNFGGGEGATYYNIVNMFDVLTWD